MEIDVEDLQTAATTCGVRVTHTHTPTHTVPHTHSQTLPNSSKTIQNHPKPSKNIKKHRKTMNKYDVMQKS